MVERKLNKNIAFPPSHQLIEILRDLILKNNYQAGQPFFTENELVEKYKYAFHFVKEKAKNRARRR